MTLNLTVAGLNVLYRALSGTQIVFTRIKLGNGAEQTLDAVADLVNPLLSVNITEIDIDDGHAVISAPFNNSTIDAGFRMTEVGVFCQNPLDDTQEVLFAYGHEPSETADYIAASSGEIRETEISFLVFIGDSENVSAVINESAVYASKTDFDEHTSDNGNPHSVTAQQVGLGNVPNVATNDQTPTYSPASTPAHLVSGEKLSAAFAKIAAAVSALISHLAHRNNPHAVTATQVGAAKAAHTHSAADITSGTIGVARGGTGKSLFSKNGILYAQNQTAIGQIDAPSIINKFLTQGPSGAPSFEFVSSAVCGSYVGNGSYGGISKTRLGFEYRPIPKLILIRPDVGGNEMYAIIPPLQTAAAFGDQLGDSFSGCTVTSEQDGAYGMVYLASNGSAINCANENGVTYNYVAIF